MDIGFRGLTALGFGLQDYEQMFALSDNELKMNILDCRAGASAFAANMHQKGHHVVATDPIYDLSFDEIQSLIQEGKAALVEALTKKSSHYGIKVPDVDSFLQAHEAHVDEFLNDFSQGKKEGRYLSEALPLLNFDNETFDLALVNHFLFTYSRELDLAYHLKAIEELLRVANEVRLFPLVTESGEISPIVGEVISQAQMKDFGAELISVDYKLQAKGGAMLRLISPTCSVSAHQS